MANIAIWEKDKANPIKVIRTDSAQEETEESKKSAASKELKNLKEALMLSTLEKQTSCLGRFA